MNEDERWSELENAVASIAATIEENIGGDQGHRLMDEILIPLEEAVYSLRPDPGREAANIIESINEAICQISSIYTK